MRRACDVFRDVLRVVLLSAISYIFFLMCCRVGMSGLSPHRAAEPEERTRNSRGRGAKTNSVRTLGLGGEQIAEKCVAYLLGLHCTYLMAAAVLLGCSLWRCLVPSADKPASAAKKTHALSTPLINTRDAAGRARRAARIGSSRSVRREPTSVHRS